jgi:ABC-type branched-subunit amino acid transport system ATPase component
MPDRSPGAAALADVPPEPGVPKPDPILVVDHVRRSFGGLTAVNVEHLELQRGCITSLIGPNGAGKTTTFNVCTGLLTPSEGRVHLEGEDITRLSPQARAQRGIGRTFQRMELYDSLSVLDNVRLGREAGIAASNPLRHLFARRDEVAEIEEAAREAIDLCRIGDIVDRQVGSLSTGQRRLVELARAVAGTYRILLLDEPSSGLDPSETGAFGDTLLAVVEQRGTGILLVEHDMALVMRICEHLYVLDFGKLVFDGPPKAVAESEIVRAAYLGSDVPEMA